MRRVVSLDYVAFFAETLGGLAHARYLYDRADAAPDRTAKIVLHQTARLVTLADSMDEVAPARPALKVFFFVVAAEAIAKLAFGFAGDGQSRRHVHRFFEELCPPSERDALAGAFRRTGTTPHALLSASEAIDVLYDVRNDVAHRGEYFEFNLLEAGHVGTIFPHNGASLQAHLAPAELRAIVLRGAVAAVENLLVATP